MRECAAQQIGIVGYQSVHSPTGEAQKLTLLIHRPRQQFQAPTMHLLDQSSRNQLVVRNEGRDWHLGPALSIAAMIADIAERHVGIDLVNPQQYVGQKRRDNIASRNRTRPESSRECFLVAADLQFYVEISFVAEVPEHVFQTCEFAISVLYIRVIGGRDFPAVNLRIVTQHSAPIACEAHIELESVAAARKRVFERRDGVFSGKFRLRSAHTEPSYGSDAAV